MKSHVGTDILDKFVENTREYQGESDTNKQKEMKAEAFNKWMAYLLIRNINQGKYGSLMNGLVSQFSMENNQYPETVTAATDIPSNHRHDNWKNQTQRKSW
jgi:sarcosine oxidase delta subunit